MGRRRMPGWPHQYPIGATAEFDRYPTGRDLVILGPPLAANSEERC
jgi:hypothetical protein